MSHNKVPILPLETPRLLLRPLRQSDAEQIQLLFPHWNVLKYMASAIPWPYPPDGASEFVKGVMERMAAREDYYWALLRKGHESEGLIGVVGLTPSAADDHRGFWLAEAHWRQGYMKEAIAAVNDFAFDVLEMSEMLLNNAAPNIGSHRLKELAGAEIIEIADRQYVGGTYPGVKWRMTAEAWRANRHRFSADQTP